MGTDISTWGERPTPFSGALRAQPAVISRIVGDEYEFVIPDLDGGKNRFGPAPGPSGLVVEDDVYAIPAVDGTWFIISTNFSVAGGGGGIEEEADPIALAALSLHEADTTGIHGIANTANLIIEGDVRLTDARTPIAHAASHASGGSDPVTPAAIGAATTAALAAHEADTTAIHGIANTADLVLTSDARLSDTRVPTDLSVTNAKVSATAAIAYSKLNLTNSILHADIAASGIGYAKLSLTNSISNADIAAAAAIAESKLSLASDAAAGTASRRTLGTGATQAAAGNDSRFTDARTPTSHASTHATAGSDPVTPAAIGAATAADIAAHEADTTAVHGIANTANLLTTAGGTLTGALLLADGAVATPSLAFGTDTDLGFYRGGANDMRFATASTDRVMFDSSGIRVMSGQFRAPDGAAATPGFAFHSATSTGFRRTAAAMIVVMAGTDRINFTNIGEIQGTSFQALGTAAASAPDFSYTNDPNTGMRRTGTDTQALVTNGVDRLTLDATNIAQAGGQFFHPLGSAALPSISFSGDPNTGVYSPGADQVAMSVGGTNRLNVTTGGVQVLGATNMRQPSTANNSWAALMQCDGTATGLRYLILAQSAVDTVADNEFYVLDNGTVRADGTIVGGGADYAEWFEHDAPMKVGDVVGFNTATGKVRKYVAGDPLVGIVSDKPAFAAGIPTPMGLDEPQGYTLVALLGQVDVDSAQVTVDRRSVLTSLDRRRIGFRLANGKVFITPLGLISLPGAA